MIERLIIYSLFPLIALTSALPVSDLFTFEEYEVVGKGYANDEENDFSLDLGRAILELNICDRICKFLGKTGGMNYNLFMNIPPCQCFCTVPGFKQKGLCYEEETCGNFCMFNNFTEGGKCLNSKCICNDQMSNKKCPFSSYQWISGIKSPLSEYDKPFEEVHLESDKLNPMGKKVVHLCLPNGTIAVNNCDGLENGNYVHPFNCSRYVACKENKLFDMPCPRHLFFNPYKGVKGEGECDYPDNVKCEQAEKKGEIIIAPFVSCEDDEEI